MKQYHVTESELAQLVRMANVSGQRAWRPTSSLAIFSVGPNRVFAPPGRSRTKEAQIVDLTGRSWLLDALAEDRRRLRDNGGRLHITRAGSTVWLDLERSLSLASFKITADGPPVRQALRRPIQFPRFEKGLNKKRVNRLATPVPSLPIVDAPTRRDCPRCWSSSFNGRRCDTCKFGDSTEWGALS